MRDRETRGASRRPCRPTLAKHVVLKYTPHLVFHLDDSIERGARVIKIMQEIESTAKTSRERARHPNLPKSVARCASTDKFAVLSHVRPDGDALGSSWRSHCHCENSARSVRSGMRMECSRNTAFCRRPNCLTTPPSEPEDFDVAVALDTAVQNRLGTAARRRAQRQTVDQHRSSPEQPALRRSGLHRSDFARDRPDSFRTSQARNFRSTREIAENLFVAISTDTGSFQYPNTTARTFEIAAELVRMRRRCRASQPVTLRKFSAPPDRAAARTARHDAIRCDGKIASFSLSLATGRPISA